MAEIAGLKLIVPSSVSASGGATATVSASGKITFSDVSSSKTFTIEDCFSASYDNYLFVVRIWDGSGESLCVRLRASGSDASGTNYVRQSINAASTTVNSARATGQTLMRIASTGGGVLRNGSHAYIYGPYLAQPTAFRNTNVADASGAQITDFAGTHSLSTSYTSVRVLSESAAEIDGTIQIYGLAQ